MQKQPLLINYDKYVQLYNIRPADDGRDCKQSEEVFLASIEGSPQTISMHDYEKMYRVPKLYDAMIYGMLKCRTPYELAGVFKATLLENAVDPKTLRMLEIGAGSGAFAEALRREMPVGRITGLDIIESARTAANRDRPNVYDDYIVADLCKPSEEVLEAINRLAPNCVGVASATGWGNHIPVRGFEQALSFLSASGWFIFHVKPNDPDPECIALIEWIEKKLSGGEIVNSERGKLFHRLSVAKKEIYYDYFIGQKAARANGPS